MYLFCLLGALSNLFANASYRARSSASSSIGDDDDDDDASPVPSSLDAANPRVAANTRERPPTPNPTTSFDAKLNTPTTLRFADTVDDADARSVAAHARVSVLDAVVVLDMFDRGGFVCARARVSEDSESERIDVMECQTLINNLRRAC